MLKDVSDLIYVRDILPSGMCGYMAAYLEGQKLESYQRFKFIEL